MTWKKFDDSITAAAGPLTALIPQRLAVNTVENAKTRLKRHSFWFPCWGSAETAPADFQYGDLTGHGADTHTIGLTIASPVQRPVCVPVAFPLSTRAKSVRVTLSAIAGIASGTARVDCRVSVAVAGDLLPGPMTESDLVIETGAISPDFRKFRSADNVRTITATPFATGEAIQFHRFTIACDTRRDDCVRVRTDEAQQPAVILLNFLSRVSDPTATGSNATLTAFDDLPLINYSHSHGDSQTPFACFRYTADVESRTGGTQAVTNELASTSQRGCLYWPPLRALPGENVSAREYPVSFVRIYGGTIEEVGE